MVLMPDKHVPTAAYAKNELENVSYLYKNIFKQSERSESFLPRDALLSAVYAVVVSVCLSVCVSVTLRYCIKTAKRRITQITPHDSPLTLVF